MFNLKDILIYKSTKLPVLNFICVFIIFFTVLFSFPLLILLPSDTISCQSLICVFSTEAISALSIALLILKRHTLANFFNSHPVPAIALTAVFTITVLHFILFDNYSSRDFFFSITLFVIPFAIYAYSSEAKSIIVHFLSLIWLINTIHCFGQVVGNSNCIGISGNQNWNASLILATSPFVTYFIYKRLAEKNISARFNLFLSSIPVLVSLYFIYLCDSKGAWVSLIAVCFVAFIVYFPGLKRRFLLRFLIYSMLLLALFVLFEGNLIAGFIFNDVRFSLWHSTFRLFTDNPFLGVGCPSFESAYAQYRPIDYFIKSHYFAFRTTHPHNELLYILACFGILGAASWIVLWIYPLLKLFQTFKKLDIIIKLSLLSLSVLVIHSMFDLILSQWPTIFIACVLLGLLWQECWPIKRVCSTGILPGNLNASSNMIDLSLRKSGYFQNFLISISLILSFSAFILFSYQDFRYSSNTRNSEIAFYSYKNPAKSLVYLNDAINYIPAPPSISHCGIVSSAIFKDNVMSLFYFDKLLKTSCPQIAHSNRHIAEALLKSGRRKEALAFLRKDTRNFPISVVSLYMELSLENELGQKKDAELTAERLLNALRHMGLTEKHIPLILKNPYYENKFVELRNMSK
jgi:O-antigen ligase